MAQNLAINGVTYNSVNSLSIPKSAGGSATFPDTTDATAVAADILSGKTAYAKGVKVTGNIPSKTAQTFTPSTSNQTISSGQYLSGAQTVLGDADLVAGNIKKDVQIFGVTGTYEGGFPKPPADGKTRLYIHVEYYDAVLAQVILNYNQTVGGDVIIDWGDGSATVRNWTVGNCVVAKTYASPGNYVISMTSTSAYTLGRNSSDYSVIGDEWNVISYPMLLELDVGNRASLGSYTCQRNGNLRYVRFLAGSGSIGDYAFKNHKSLIKITTDEGMTRVGTQAFYENIGINEMTFPASLTSIGDQAFRYMRAIRKFHFKSITPPTLEGSSVFYFPVGPTIYVPSASLTAYKDATNWSAHASYMVGE